MEGRQRQKKGLPPGSRWDTYAALASLPNTTQEAAGWGKAGKAGPGSVLEVGSSDMKQLPDSNPDPWPGPHDLEGGVYPARGHCCHSHCYHFDEKPRFCPCSFPHRLGGLGR